MKLRFLECLVFVGILCGFVRPSNIFHTYPESFKTYLTESEELDGTKIMLAFVIHRHGDRTPKDKEIAMNPAGNYDKNYTFLPFGQQALNSRGKKRGFEVGRYIRKRYDSLVSKYYLANEITIRTTAWDRTKMTALAAMAAMFEPPPELKWKPDLNWTPVPYSTPKYDEDDMLYTYNCPRYRWLKNKTHEEPEVHSKIASFKEFFNYLSEKTQGKIKTPSDIYSLSNLFQCLNSLGEPPPQWAIEAAEKINQLMTLEFAIILYNCELIRLASGVLLNEIHNVSKAFVKGQQDMPKLRIYSAHENNVAALMAAANAYEPHQPHYGATFSLELRRRETGEYGFVAVYAIEPTDEGRLIPIKGCGEKIFCDFNQFISITKDHAWTNEEYRKNCSRTT